MDQHELIGRLSFLTNNIIDTIDKNGPDSIIDEVDAIEKAVANAENLRNEYLMLLEQARRLLNDKYKELIGKSSISILVKLKNYIKFMNHHTKTIHLTTQQLNLAKE